MALTVLSFALFVKSLYFSQEAEAKWFSDRLLPSRFRFIFPGYPYVINSVRKMSDRSCFHTSENSHFSAEPSNGGIFDVKRHLLSWNVLMQFMLNNPLLIVSHAVSVGKLLVMIWLELDVGDHWLHMSPLVTIAGFYCSKTQNALTFYYWLTQAEL